MKSRGGTRFNARTVLGGRVFLFLLFVLCCSSGSSAKIIIVGDSDESFQIVGQGRDKEVEATGTTQEDPSENIENEEEWDWEAVNTGGLNLESDADLHPGWWRIPYEAPVREVENGIKAGKVDALYALGMKRLLGGLGASRDVPVAFRVLQEAADRGHSDAQSALAFMHGMGLATPISRTKAFLYHSFAAQNGSLYSKMALAYDYYRQQELELAVPLYAEVAAHAMAVISLPGKARLVELWRLNDGMEENREATEFQKGEDDETTQLYEYTAQKGDKDSLRTLGYVYYWGARGMTRDHGRALDHFRMAAQMGDLRAMLMLGEMLVRGLGTPEDPEAALQWFQRAADKNFPPAHNGIGYLYARGKGVPRNLTKAIEHFRRGGSDGAYNLGIMYLRGYGLRRNEHKAYEAFNLAAQPHDIHLGALYQLARMCHHGIGTPRNLAVAVGRYKAVAEQGPWGTMLRWGHDCYLGRCSSRSGTGAGLGSLAPPGIVSALGGGIMGRGAGGAGTSSTAMMGTSFLLYARAAELGYEVAQANAAWLLERLGRVEGRPGSGASGAGRRGGVEGQEGRVRVLKAGGGACVGPLGFPCTREERQERALRLWRQASEQRNVQATLLVGDAFFFGRGVGKSLERAVEAYRRAKQLGNSQAIFNLGYMHERGLGLRPDLNLAKRYYDEALNVKQDAALPVKLALAGLWMRRNYPNSVLIQGLDMLPELLPWLQDVTDMVLEQLQDDGNRALLTLVACLVAVLALRARIRRPLAGADVADQRVGAQAEPAPGAGALPGPGAAPQAPLFPPFQGFGAAM